MLYGAEKERQRCITTAPCIVQVLAIEFYIFVPDFNAQLPEPIYKLDVAFY